MTMILLHYSFHMIKMSLIVNGNKIIILLFKVAKDI